MRRLFLPLILTLGLLSVATVSMAQDAPYAGQLVLNQGVELRVVTKSNSTVLIQTRALYNGNATACDIAVIAVNDTAAVTLSNVPSGALIPISVTKVMSTGTTCSSIVAIY